MRADINTSLIRTVSRMGSTQKIKQLLKDGANPNAANEKGKTALMYAVSNSYIPAVEILIAAGADVNARDNNGKNALMYVKIPSVIVQSDGVSGASVEQALAEMNIKLLLDAGADINATDDEGKTALALAKENNLTALVQLLQSAGAKD